MDTLLRRHLWALDLVVLGTVALLAARATAHVTGARLLRLCADEATPVTLGPAVSGATPDGAAELDGVDEIVRRNIFCSACRGKRNDGGATAAHEPVLSLRLVAVMLAAPPADPGHSVAVIKDERGAAGAYAIGSRLGGAVVDAIDATSVSLRLPDGRRQALGLLDGAGVPQEPMPRPASQPLVAELERGIEKRGENRYGVRRATIESLLAKMDTLAPQARVEPDLRDGQPIGFRLRDVKEDGVFAKIGLREGDLISSVNGLATNGGDNALAIYASLRSAEHLSVGLERGGRRITTEYDIE